MALLSWGADLSLPSCVVTLSSSRNIVLPLLLSLSDQNPWVTVSAAVSKSADRAAKICLGVSSLLGKEGI